MRINFHLYKKEGLIQTFFFNYNSSRCELKLICGFDYINPDNNDIQGWVDASRFTKESQSEDIIVLHDENLLDRLDEEGFKVLDKLPKIYVIRNDYLKKKSF